MRSDTGSRVSRRAPPHAPIVRRILVGLDGSSASLAALEAAAALAEEAGADLHGLFVEDTQLLALANDSTAIGIHYPSGSERRLDIASLERELRAQASEARRAVSRAVLRKVSRWEFTVTRGDVAARIFEAAQSADLIVLGKLGRTFPGRARLGSTARFLAEEAMRPVLLVAEEPRGGAILSVFDGSFAGTRGLDLAVLLSRASNAPLRILIPGESPDPGGLEDEAAERAREGGAGSTLPIMVARSGALAEAAAAEDTSTLALAVPSLLTGEILDRWMADPACSILLVR